MSVKYVQVDSREFFVMYNTVRLYFSGKFDVEKYGLGNKKLQNGFNNNKLKHIYEAIAKQLKNKEIALIYILQNFLQDNKNFITNFNIQADSKLLLYYFNKQQMINDFAEEIEKCNLINRIKSGQLYTELMFNNYKPELFANINQYIPIIKIAESYSTSENSENINQLLFGNNDSNLQKANIIISKFLFDKTNKKEISKKLFEILENKLKENNTETYRKTENTEEDIEYGYFNC